MSILVVFAFLAGVVTILSPCILPVLPVILSSSVTGSKRHSWGVVLGFVLSFTFFTLFLTGLVNLTGIDPNITRDIAIVIIGLFGLVLVFPPLQKVFERFTSGLAATGSKASSKKKSGLLGGALVGASLGLIWTPCAGPILGSVIVLSATGTVTAQSFLITFAYSLGTAVPMLAILYGGRGLIQKVPWLLKRLGAIQKVFGVLMILVAIAMYFNLDRKFQAFIVQQFPGYGAGLTQIEELDIVREQLDGMGMEAEAAPELIQGGEWLNSEPLTLEELQGKVVLIDFWTYSCINCIRTLPYIQTWYEKYEDDGLVIIGVHTPEFVFEQSADNVRDAIADYGLTYPVMQDNNYETWRAFSNRYWPAKYLIDHNGNIVYKHFGEGSYDETERTIQLYLELAGYVPDEEISNARYRNESDTPETYLGYKRVEGFTSPGGVVEDAESVYEYPDNLGLNQFAFEGEWRVEDERAIASEGAKLKFNYKSKDVFLVMNPVGDEVGLVEVLVDGASKGVVEVDSDRLYDLVRRESPSQHELELIFLNGNVEAYAFTFG